MRSALLLAGALLACASATPPALAQTPRPPQSFAASREAVWNAVLTVFADQAIPVKASDRSSGSITTEEVAIAKPDWTRAGECGKGLLMKTRPTRVQYSVLVSGDSATTMRLSARLGSTAHTRGPRASPLAISKIGSSRPFGRERTSPANSNSRQPSAAARLMASDSNRPPRD